MQKTFMGIIWVGLLVGTVGCTADTPGSVDNVSPATADSSDPTSTDETDASDSSDSSASDSSDPSDTSDGADPTDDLLTRVMSPIYRTRAMRQIPPIAWTQLNTSPTILRFVVLGDGGEGNDAQYQVADTMKSLCDERGGCSFALYLGDNIYDDGIDTDEGLQDPRLRTSSSYLTRRWTFHFYVVLGNHDYGVVPYLKRQS